jgi:hypothetical protein
MRCLNRNKVKIYFAQYVGREDILNEDGRKTGRYRILHTNPIETYANVSAAKGETQARQFGESESYDKVIVMDNVAPLCIDEYSVLWVDTEPELNEDGSLAVNENDEIITPHDYVVKKVAKSLNNVSIAVSKVSVGG